MRAAHAAQDSPKANSTADADVRVNTDGTVAITEDGSATVVSLQDTARTRTVTLTDAYTGAIEYFVFDKVAGTVYSSVTQNSIMLSDFDGEEINGTLAPNANQPVRTYTRYEFPFSEIKKVCGAAPSAATLIGYFAGKIGIQFAPGLGAVVAGLGIAGVFLPDDGGIYIVTVLKRRYDDDGILYQTQAGIDEFGFY